MATTAIIPEPTIARLTPEQLDELADRYFAAKKTAADANAAFDKVEAEALAQVKAFGVVPPKAENSRRLDGKLTYFIVTISNTITIEEARVQNLHDALEANGFVAVFANIFQERIRHELVKGADLAILAAGMPKRVTEKVQALFGRCFSAKSKKPSLKVKRLVEKKPKRAKKASAPAAGSSKAALPAQLEAK